MGIEHKIHAIRQKPEHIRVRYTVFFVAVTMVFVIALWTLSVRDVVQKAQVTFGENEQQMTGAKEQLSQIQTALTKQQSAMEQKDTATASTETPDQKEEATEKVPTEKQTQNTNTISREKNDATTVQDTVRVNDRTNQE